jgi:hypothetical protein
MTAAIAALVVAAALVALALELRRSAREAVLAQLLALFAPAIVRAREDPREILAWGPLAHASRQLFPAAFAQLDAAAGGEFPFTRADVEAAHARWTADWLAWERAHDDEYKLKAATVEEELTRSGQPAPLVRARLAALEREQLARYQQRYEDYVRIAKALGALNAGPGAGRGANPGSRPPV